MKNKFKKYRYLGVVYPETSKFWEPTIITMLESIDKYIRPWYLPRFIYNLIYDISYKDNKITNWYWSSILKSITFNVYISQIKSKFATLRVYGIFDDKIQEFVKIAEDECDTICENCGSQGASHVMIKGWVTNLCSTCKENYKK